ncbi:alanine--tRNA ligase [Ranunculus cassubicifolius]
MEGFDTEMESQRRQSQAAHNVVKLDIGDASDFTERIVDTEFLGYDTLATRAVIEGLVVNGKSVIQVSEGSDVDILLNKTPFYAESGGQIGDNGYLYVSEFASKGKAMVEINDVKKSLGNIFVHKGIVREGSIEIGAEVEAAVDAKLRQRAKVR